MGVFDFLQNIVSREKQLKEISVSLADIKATVEGARFSTKLESSAREKRRTLSKPLQYATPATASSRTRSHSRIFHGPAYDLSEIARAMDVEPYVNQSVRKHREQILKEGFRIVGEDPEMVEYVERRLFEMMLVSDTTTESFIREYTTNLIAYATTFLIIKRDQNRSSGKPIRWHGKTLEPIAAVFPMDPTSVSVQLNKHGHPVQWLQKIENSITNQLEAHYPASDVISATIDKKPGFVFGTPYILPTLDDVRTLRRLEELTEIASAKYAYPPFHFQVGSEADPPQLFDNGTNEIDMVRVEVENMLSLIHISEPTRPY